MKTTLTSSPFSFQVNHRLNDLIACYGLANVQAKLLVILSEVPVKRQDALYMHLNNLCNTFSAYYIIDGAELSGITIRQKGAA